MSFAAVTLSTTTAAVLALACVLVGVALGVFLMGWPHEGGWDSHDF